VAEKMNRNLVVVANW